MPHLLRWHPRLARRPVMRLAFGALLAASAACSMQSVTTAAAKLPAPLRETDWKLVELDGAAVAMPAVQAREANLVLRTEGARFSGFAGCNRLAGGYTLDGVSLRFGPAVSTRMACAPDVMALESRMLAMLEAVDGWQIDGERLSLIARQRVVARFDARQVR